MASDAEAGPSTAHSLAEAAEEFVEKMTDTESPADEQEDNSKVSMEERKAKLEQLRKKMVRIQYLTGGCLSSRRPQHTASMANRASVVEESAKAKITARDAARLERQRKLAETLRLKADAEERGEDVERLKNWEWTIEENDEWEKKQARKQRRADFEFHSTSPLWLGGIPVCSAMQGRL